MRTIDFRYYVIALLVLCAAALGYYRAHHAPESFDDQERAAHSAASAGDDDPMLPAARVRSMIDTTARLLGAPRKYIARRTALDSGRTLPELAAGVPSAFDELRMIRALTDSLRPYGFGVSAVKSLKEKTTTIRILDRRRQCMYRCLLYRKELSH